MNNTIKHLPNGDFEVIYDKECNPHPDAPHGFLRDASTSAGRYVCECEWWDEKDYELASLEEAEEFDEKRNYTYEWNGVSPSVNAQWKAEKCPWDDWKSTKDIV
jgi:hypothetical protein